ncbi:MAG: DUF3137 domain-containing protein [Ignavibacteriales bacterium]
MAEQNEIKGKLLNELNPDIQNINNLRNNIGNVKLFKAWQIGLIMLIIFIIDLYLLLHKLIEARPFLDILLISGFIIFGAMMSYKKRKLAPVKNLVDQLRAKMMRSINPSFGYNPDGYINEDIYMRSGLFNEMGNKYSGSSFVKGKLGYTNFMMSYVISQNEHDDHADTLFDGMFMVAEFNKRFSGRTVVLPDIAENTFGNIIGTWLQKNNKRIEKLAKLEDAEFEKRFAVYSTDQIQARYLLTPGMMERLVELRNKFKSISVSFVDNRMFLAIPSFEQYNLEIPYEGLIEPDSVWEVYNEMKNMIGIIETIINELGLNNRLWTNETDEIEDEVVNLNNFGAKIDFSSRKEYSFGQAFLKTVPLQVIIFAILFPIAFLIYENIGIKSSEFAQTSNLTSFLTIILSNYKSFLDVYYIANFSVLLSTITAVTIFSRKAVFCSDYISGLGISLIILPIMVFVLIIPSMNIYTFKGVVPFCVGIVVLAAIIIYLRQQFKKIPIKSQVNYK